MRAGQQLAVRFLPLLCASLLLLAACGGREPIKLGDAHKDLVEEQKVFEIPALRGPEPTDLWVQKGQWVTVLVRSFMESNGVETDIPRGPVNEEVVLSHVGDLKDLGKGTATFRAHRDGWVSFEYFTSVSFFPRSFTGNMLIRVLVWEPREFPPIQKALHSLAQSYEGTDPAIAQRLRQAATPSGVE